TVERLYPSTSVGAAIRAHAARPSHRHRTTCTSAAPPAETRPCECGHEVRPCEASAGRPAAGAGVLRRPAAGLDGRHLAGAYAPSRRIDVAEAGTIVLVQVALLDLAALRVGVHRRGGERRVVEA